MIKWKVKECIHGQMGRHTMESGKTVTCMVEVLKHGAMAQSTLEATRMAERKVKGYSAGRME